MELATSNPVESRFRVQLDAMTLVIVAYLIWFVATPWQTSRLSFLSDIHFERWLAGALIVASLSYGNISRLFAGLTIAVFCLFGFMAVSHLFSSYPDFLVAINWGGNYWKRMIFFACIVVALKDETRIRNVLLMLLAVVFLYQLYSLIDFMRGGSYVHQQGVKRMIGVWSGGGLGAANGLGFLGLFSLPLTRYSYLESNTRNQRRYSLLAALLSMTCIVLSGTRGALIVAVFWMALVFWKYIFRIDRLLLFALVLAIVIPALSDDVKHRYWDQMMSVFSDEQEFDSRTDEIASISAQSRIDGLVNGFRLGARQPLFGYGPGTSAKAVQELTGAHDDYYMQLHNLYGQIAAELGLTGFFIWSGIILACLFTLWRIHREEREEYANSRRGRLARSLMGLFFVLILYGMVGHILYSEEWLVVIGCTIALAAVPANDSLETG